MADHASVDHYMGQKQKFSGSHEEDAYRLHRKRFAGGAYAPILRRVDAFLSGTLAKALPQREERAEMVRALCWGARQKFSFSVNCT